MSTGKILDTTSQMTGQTETLFQETHIQPEPQLQEISPKQQEQARIPPELAGLEIDTFLKGMV